MKSTATRTVSLIIGGLAILVGAVWIGQGAGLIKGQLHDRQPNVARHRSAVPGRRTVLDLPDISATSSWRCLRSAATLLRGKISASPTLIDIARATDRLGIIGQLLHRPSIAVGIAEEHE
jgi:hypothetical protein